jgi:TRAP-type C4-dicarboxylate transport system permease small subunit
VFGEVLRQVAFFERFVRLLSKFCDRIAQVSLFAMFLLISINILLRKFWKPIFATYDYTCFLSAIVVAFAMAHCAVQRGHTEVELLVSRFSQRVQGVIGSITGILSLGLFFVITWQCIVLGNDIRRAGEVTMSALLPFYPYIYAVAFGCALLSLVILVDFIKSLSKAVKG